MSIKRIQRKRTKGWRMPLRTQVRGSAYEVGEPLKHGFRNTGKIVAPTLSQSDLEELR